jgi:hypothetical protein
MDDRERRLAGLWATTDDYAPDEFCARVRALSTEQATADAVALFELAKAHDATGLEQQAAVLYRQALGGDDGASSSLFGMDRLSTRPPLGKKNRRVTPVTRQFGNKMVTGWG